MILDFTQNGVTSEDKKYILHNRILSLIALFGNLKTSEILDFFPTESEKIIKNSISTLLKTKQLQYAYRDYLITPFLNRNDVGIKIRKKYKKCREFLIWLINVKTSQNILVNNVSLIARPDSFFPFQFFIECNNKIFYIMDCAKEDIAILNQILDPIDEGWMKKIEKYYSDTDLQNFEVNNRIIIVDEPQDMRYIHFRFVKYIVCPKDNSYIIQEGT